MVLCPSRTRFCVASSVSGAHHGLGDGLQRLGAAALRGGEDLLLHLLQVLLHVAGGLVALGRVLLAGEEHPPDARQLLHHRGVVPDVAGGADALRQREGHLPGHGRAEEALGVEALVQEHRIDGRLLRRQLGAGREDELVRVQVEVVGLEAVGDEVEGRVVDEHRPEHRLLGLEVVRQVARGAELQRGRGGSSPGEVLVAHGGGGW
jgi:hypothetical protein